VRPRIFLFRKTNVASGPTGGGGRETVDQNRARSSCYIFGQHWAGQLRILRSV